MSQIIVTNLSFSYDSCYDPIFEHVSFSFETDWKLGMIGRNGKGKTTFMNLLLGKYEYEGSIVSSVKFEYFPFTISEQQMKNSTLDVIEQFNPEYELWKILIELKKLQADEAILYQTFDTLSFGEQTKIMLAVLFTKENSFLLIDEPTNHLDQYTREVLWDYLHDKHGFLLVSHDRWLLDECVDHMLVLNRQDIQIEKGNFHTWWENKQRRDHFEQQENIKYRKEIKKLEASARQSQRWAQKCESTKIGFHPNQEHDRFIDTRAYIGEKSRRMQSRKKNILRRKEEAIEEKSKLLRNIETVVDLKLYPLEHYRETYIRAKNLSLSYSNRQIIDGIDFEIKKGEVVQLFGKNGSGKSSIINAILAHENVDVLNDSWEQNRSSSMNLEGELDIAKGLKVSYISQDTSLLTGTLDDYIERNHLDATLIRGILRQLDFERIQFEKDMSVYSQGQKKKVLIASSLATKAHLYIWDEPLNYVDVFSRMQIESLIRRYHLTMVFVEHDKSFAKTVGSKVISL